MGSILRLPYEICNKFNGIPKIRFRHGISTLGACKLLKTFLRNMHLLTDRAVVRSVFFYDADINRGLLAIFIGADTLK
jgi:hypothetical protein